MAPAPPAQGCIHVYDGYPALYRMTRSCLPTRWAFPGHLSAKDEASVAALGVEPSDEVRRIMSRHPDAVVNDYPRFVFGNAQTHAIVQDVLDRDYDLTACIANGQDRRRLVYRLRPAGRRGISRSWSIPHDCPATHVGNAAAWRFQE